MRGWLGTGAPNTPISDYRPWNERKGIAGGFATPNSARIARRGLMQCTLDGNQNGEDGSIGWRPGDGPQQTVSSPDFWNPRTVDTDADSSRSVPSQRKIIIMLYFQQDTKVSAINIVHLMEQSITPFC